MPRPPPDLICPFASFAFLSALANEYPGIVVNLSSVSLLSQVSDNVKTSRSELGKSILNSSILFRRLLIFRCAILKPGWPLRPFKASFYA